MPALEQTQLTPEVLTVTELNQLFNTLLESSVPQISFAAEIAECTRASSGHFYLSLKDDRSQLSAVIWRGVAQSLTFKPTVGAAVICRGRPNVYHVTGRLQVVLSQIELAGEGLLQKKFLELKKKLEAEGLFDSARKRVLPFLPRAIGIVTSREGAVIHDMQVKLRERMPQIPTYLINVRVQGEGAAAEIAAAVQQFSNSGLVDVIIVARGGGSLQDLWAFNEEPVVRAVFASRVPVVSGVGHEVDVTLCDLVADVRAPTPTAAAEMVTPLREELLRRVLLCEQRLSTYKRWLEPLVQRVDELQLALKKRVFERVEFAEAKLLKNIARLESIQPRRLLTQLRSRVDLVSGKLRHVTERSLVQRRSRLENLQATFAAMNPLKVLERGYALVEQKGKVVRRASDLKVDDQVHVVLSQGSVDALIRKVSVER